MLYILVAIIFIWFSNANLESSMMPISAFDILIV